MLVRFFEFAGTTVLLAFSLAFAIHHHPGPSAANLVALGRDSPNWALPAHEYGGNRYVASTITPANVRNLARAWVFRIPGVSMMEAAPLVWEGTLYVSSGRDDVYALDAKTGAPKWSYSYHPTHAVAFEANRGVALLDGRLYLGTVDGHVLALDAATGTVLWNVQGVHDPANSFYAMAPVPYKNLVLIGASNGDWGGAGYVTAFDAKSGRHVWEWQSIPGPGVPGHETWAGDSWKRGGGSVWGGLTLDPATGTLFVDTGNPQPDLLGSVRAGANLYTDSMVALDVSSGAPKLKWYHQFVAHDTHDWDPAMPPVRFTGIVKGVQRRLVAAADKGGDFWVLDASNGQLVEHAVVSTQRGHDTEPTARGTLACPGTNGGVQYNGGSYLPETNAFYVPSIDQCAVFTSSGTATYLAGREYFGGEATVQGPSSGWMSAVDLNTGGFLWRKKLALPGLGGALSLSTGLVFSGQLDGDFIAYDAKTGAVLWHFPTGSAIKAPASAYVVDGKPYVAVASGWQGSNFELPGVPRPGEGSIVSAFTLP
jgi:alcohol dehydrogenase (cytochrome c)